MKIAGYSFWGKWCGARSMSKLLKNPDTLSISSCQVKVDGLNIHCKRLGQGYPLILLHGGGNDWREWQQNIFALAGHFQVYAPDLPGFGQSEAPRQAVSRDWSILFIKHLLDALGIGSSYLIGHSMGAMVALAFTGRFPEVVRKLVLVDAVGIGPISRPGQVLLSLIRTINTWQGKRQGPQYQASTMQEWIVPQELTHIKCPTLIMWGQNDRYLPVAQAKVAQRLIADSLLCVFPYCGHAPQREEAERFNQLALQFLVDGATG
jgi:pimeloyl-ACP methyl ester carboxylesterase